MFSNPKGLELSGYSEEEVTSRPFLEFVHPDDRQTAFELYQEAMEGEGARKARVFRVVDRWGKVRWGHVGAVRIEWDGRPAVLVFGIEITELKQAEEALRESEQRFRALAEGAPFGVALIKQDGTFHTSIRNSENCSGTISKIYPMAENGSEGHILMRNTDTV